MNHQPKIILLAGLGLLVLVGSLWMKTSNQQPKEEAHDFLAKDFSNDFHSELDGIETKKLSINTEAKPFDITLTEVDLTKRSLSLISSQAFLTTESGEPITSDSGEAVFTYGSGNNLNEFIQSANFAAVHSGGYLSSIQPAYPLGYIKVRTVTLNKPHKTWITDGFICTDGKKIVIDAYKNEAQFEPWPDCLQSGPLLVQNNSKATLNNTNDPKFVNGKHKRSFICLAQDNQVFMGITSEIDLFTLASFLSKPKNENGLGCKDAIALTGGNTAGMLVRTTEHGTPRLIESGNLNVLLPNAIAVK